MSLQAQLSQQGVVVTGRLQNLPAHNNAMQQFIGVGSIMSHTAQPAAGNADAVALVPFARWDLEAHPHEAANARFGAYLAAIELFDAAAFSLSGVEAAVMDPQQRLLLQSFAEAVLGRSATGVELHSAAQGVYVGIASSEHGSLVQQHSGKGPYHATGSAVSVASGRLSYTFGMSGPSMSIGGGQRYLSRVGI